MPLLVNINCPNCDKRHRVTFDRVNSGTAVKCSCNIPIEFSVDDVRRIKRDLNREIQAFQKMLVGVSRSANRL